MIPAVRAIARAAMAARPAPLAEVQARAELLARFSTAYLVPVDVFAAFAAELTDRRRPGGPFAALCINGRRWFRYRSVYYDTPDLRSFHDHRQRNGLRFKIRERLYADTGERQFEVKLKGEHGRTVKHRRPLMPGDPALGPAPRDFLATVLDRSYGIQAPTELGRSIETDYQRATFVADGQRVTCDAALVCRDLETGRSIRADGGLVVVETKTAGRLTEADRLLAGYGVPAADFTKYCGGLSALRPHLHANHWRGPVRTAFPAAAAA
ncbi:polyphosphate polymerase domain-containing protein [Streptomyces sp. BHT-5-2]|uniref:polyphosphate polymerase domain-containing protein n=1 Tax=unclassified Streptomyces TaxID=2593676 RepID=UPI001C8E2AF8|nr:polyphosphate polymerase domain-containing protein [Streptomyces sp. BHT-5-2]QZL02753.1 polyphosphate polymerase domain-containing protein [Streptomyces sp. BHT-5-2]